MIELWAPTFRRKAASHSVAARCPSSFSYFTCFAAHSAGGSCEVSFARYTAPNPPSPSLRPRLTSKWPILTIDMLAALAGLWSALGGLDSWAPVAQKGKEGRDR